MKNEKEVILGIPDIYSKEIIGLFRGLKPDIQLVLFGSRAKGNFREGSDIDLALKGDSITISDRDLLLLKYADLNLPWRLDLVIYNLISEPELKLHIDRVGQVLL